MNGEAEPGSLPPTCQIKGWLVFGPGYHRGDYYSPEMCRRIVENFNRLRTHTIPRAKYGTEIPGSDPGAKIGHDRTQLVAERLKNSMGFLSLGKVVRCEEVPGYPGYIKLGLDGVPTRTIGGECNAGRILGGSVELLPKIPDPEDPAKEIEGPILSGIAFLGEEQPAVRDFPEELRERTQPRATFPDGTPVPANPEPPDEWQDAMSFAMRHVQAKFADQVSRDRVRARGRDYSLFSLCFSDLFSETVAMDHKAKLMAAGYPEDQATMMAAAIPPDSPVPGADAGATPPPEQPATPMGDMTITHEDDDAEKAFAEACKKYADDPDATPEQKMFAAYFSASSKKFADMTKRMGAMEAQAAEKQKAADDAEMAQFSADVEKAVGQLIRKIPPNLIEKVYRPELMGILTSKQFSSHAEKLKTFSDRVGELLALPDDPSLKGASVAQTGRQRPLTPLQQQMLRGGGILAREYPDAVQSIRETAAPKV